MTIGAPDRTGTRIRWLRAAGSSDAADRSCRAPLGVPVVPDVIRTTRLTRPGLTGSGRVSAISASTVPPPSAHATTRSPPNPDSSTAGPNSSSWTSSPISSRSTTCPSCLPEKSAFSSTTSLPSRDAARTVSTNPRWLRHRTPTFPSPMRPPSAVASDAARRSSSA